MLCALYYSYMYIDLTVYLWICIFILIESRLSFLWRKESCQDLNLSTSVRTPHLLRSNWLIASYQKKSKQKVTTHLDSFDFDCGPCK